MLAERTANFSVLGGPALEALTDLAATLPAYSLRFDDLDEAKSALMELCARSERATGCPPRRSAQSVYAR
jgi:hypothetical protein